MTLGYGGEMKRRWWRVFLIALWVLLGYSGAVQADSGGISLVGQDLAIEAGQTVRGDVAVVAGNVQVARNATVLGDLAVVGGSVSIGGIIDGDAVVLGGEMALGPRAVVHGDVVVLGSLARDPAARVDGQVVVTGKRNAQLDALRQRIQAQVVSQAPTAQGRRPLEWLRGFLRWIGTLIGLAILALVVAAVAAEPVQHVTTMMERSFPLSVAVGLVTLLVAVLMVPLLVVIIVGIPVAVILGVALVLALVLGGVSAARLIGQRCLAAFKTTSSSALIDTLIGLVVLALLGRVPCLGWLITFVVLVWSLGAVVLTRFGTSPHLVWSPFAPLAGTVGLQGEIAPERSIQEEDRPFEKRDDF